MRPAVPSSLAASLLLIGLLAACDRGSNPIRPSPNDETRTAAPPTPAPGNQAVLTSVRVDGPAVVPPGETATYTATATWSDGSSSDVTSEAQWSSTNESALAVTAAGTVTARANGAADVQAAFRNLTHHRSVVVVPAGRFRLSVSVGDGLIPNAPIFGARAEVISGPAAGLTATSDWNGGLVLYGVPPEVELRVTKDGYEPVVQSVHVDSNWRGVSVNLFPAADRPALSGRYRLTVNADICAGDGALPDEARARTYTAAIWEPGGKVKVQLSDASFDIKTCCFGEQGDGFSGLTQVLDTRFTLIPYEPDWDWNAGVHPSVAERLPNGSVLTISGRAIVRPTPEGFSGLLDGTMAIYDSLPLSGPGGRMLASCQSTSHHFTLTRWSSR